MRKLLFILSIVLCPWVLSGQSSIAYTVDQEFNTLESLRSTTSVFDIYPLADGGYFLGGGFDMTLYNPFSPFTKGFAMVSQDGSLHPDWEDGQTVFCREIHSHDGGYLYPALESLSKSTFGGTSWYFFDGDMWGDYFKIGEFGSGFENPYNVRWTWDIFILEDESVLIGGAIATDTLQPNLFRHLMRLLPDGSHDAAFPIIEAMPQGLNTHISKIERASDGSWYVSGRFEGINGHISPHIAHLTADFEVDTDFVSPFVYESISSGFHTEMKLLDSQDRLWFSGRRVKLANNPNDELALVRLLPDGTVDPDFQVGRIEINYPVGWYIKPSIVSTVIETNLEEEVYFIGGSFSHYNNTAQPCISALDSNGSIQENYFGNQGSTFNTADYQNPDDLDAPAIRTIEILEDGNLMIGGSFSDFMGELRYSLVKLNQGTVGTVDHERLENALKVFPNPTSGTISVQVNSTPLNDHTSASAAGSSSATTTVAERSRSDADLVQILDLSGRTVLSFPWQGDFGTYDISELAKGAYLIQLIGDDGILGVEKIIVK
jgi:hypothetical protein